MELRRLFSLLVSYREFFLVFISFGIILCLVSYKFLPNSYVAEGTIFIYPVENTNQKSEVSNEMNYARNLIALSNTPEFKMTLSSEILSSSYIPLIGISSGIKLKEISPNILSLSLKDTEELKVKEKYLEYFKSLSLFSENLKKGNSSFELATLTQEPIVYANSKDIRIFLIVGLISGLFMYIIFVYFKND